MDEEKALFDIKVKYDKKEYIDFSKFQVYVLYRYIHVLIYFLTFFIFSTYLYKENGFCTQSILCIIFIIIYTLFIYLYPYINSFFKYLSKNKKQVTEIVVNFEVCNTCLRITSSDGKIPYTLNYHKLYRVYENKSHFYLYINKSKAYLIPKKKLTGNISNFRAILKSNVFKKYKKII